MKPRRSASRKKEYIVVFYSLDTDEEICRTKKDEPMTKKEAHDYIEWVYKYGHLRNAYGVERKIEDDKDTSES